MQSWRWCGRINVSRAAAWVYQQGQDAFASTRAGHRAGPSGASKGVHAGTPQPMQDPSQGCRIMGLRYVETIADQASPQRDRAVVPTVDVHVEFDPPVGRQQHVPVFDCSRLRHEPGSGDLLQCVR